MSSATNEPATETARSVAAAAGLQMSPERLQVFAVALVRNLEQTRPILDLDYGRAEPAARFAPPPAR
jgi:hypothetical protein